MGLNVTEMSPDEREQYESVERSAGLKSIIRAVSSNFHGSEMKDQCRTCARKNSGSEMNLVQR